MKTSTLLGRCVALMLLLPLFSVTAQPFVLTDMTTPVAQPHAANTLRAGEVKQLTTTNYTATDLIHQKQYNIGDILKSGKYLVIDFSATWCGPCWQLHSSGALERLYAKMGPEGTNQLELFWVECDGASKETITKPTKDWSKDPKGNPVPYPLFSDKKMDKALGVFVQSIPMVILIAPSGEYVLCTKEVWTTDTEFTDFTKLMDLFMTPEEKPAEVGCNIQENLFVGESLNIEAKYKTIAPITEFKWEANGLTLSATDQEVINISATTPGTYTLKLTVTNKNGSSSAEKTITVRNPISSFPFFCGMDNKDKMDTGWRSFDFDGDGLGFESICGMGFFERLGLWKEGTKQGAEGSTDGLISWGKLYPTEIRADNKISGKTIFPDNMLISAPVTIAADASNPLLSFFFSTLLDNGGAKDQVKVMVASEGKLTKENFTTTQLMAPVTGTNQWTRQIVDLSAYKGKTIWIAIVPVTRGVSGVAVDQLNVSMDGTLGTELPEIATKTMVYPNPANEAFNVATLTGSHIELFSVEGAMLQSIVAQNEITTIDSKTLAEGRYVVRVTDTNGASTVRPLIIQR